MDMMTIATVALAALTAVLAVYTRNLFLEARKTREYQTNPNVIITAAHHNDRPTLITLIIRNIGNGLALDIEFNPSKELKICFGLTEKAARIKPMPDGPLRHGIPSLGPGETRIIDWGQVGGLLHEIGNECVTIDIEYKNASDQKIHQKCKVDVASFIGTAANRSCQKQSADALEQISKTFQHLRDDIRFSPAPPPRWYKHTMRKLQKRST